CVNTSVNCSEAILRVYPRTAPEPSGIQKSAGLLPSVPVVLWPTSSSVGPGDLANRIDTRAVDTGLLRADFYGVWCGVGICAGTCEHRLSGRRVAAGKLGCAVVPRLTTGYSWAARWRAVNGGSDGCPPGLRSVTVENRAVAGASGFARPEVLGFAFDRRPAPVAYTRGRATVTAG